MQDVVGQLLGSPAVTTAVSLLAVGGVALWLAAAWWTYQDMQRRTTSEVAALGAVAWILLSTPALLPLSLPIYLLARPQRTVAQGRSTELALALQAELSAELTCPGCGGRLGDEDWRRCPTCSTWLATECDACGRWSSVRLDICPWCAVDRPALGPAGVLIGAPAPVLRPVPVEDVSPVRERPVPERQREARRPRVPARLG